MSDILQRIITGSIFITVIIFSLWYSLNATFVVMGMFLFLGLLEFFRLFKDEKNIQLNSVFNTIALFTMYCIIAFSLVKFEPQFSILILPILFTILIVEIWRKKENPLQNLGIVMLGFVYLVIPFSLILIISNFSSHNKPYVISMFLLIWTNDTFAYLSGRFLGKTKLFERISPKKTWEGTIGGLLFTLLVSYLVSFWGNNNDLNFWLISACIIAPTSILGDLLESLFKRSLNIKDSGTLLPGHGGILDRFDAMLFTVPFFYAWFVIYNYF
jgi:phosphatidate cytidylyltransferase